MAAKLITADASLPRLDATSLQKMAETFHALADAARLALVQELKSGEHTVGELTEATNMGQASVSKHLKALHDVGLLNRRKDGVRVFYSLRGDLVCSLCRMVCQKLHDQEMHRPSLHFTF
jgi:DNA-binding transcriptional ArsR family regulator